MKKLAFLFFIPLMIFIFPSHLFGMTEARCMELCEQQTDGTNLANSGDSYNKYMRCQESCSALGDAQREFKSCIRNAHTQEEKEACRDDYRHNRPKSAF